MRLATLTSVLVLFSAGYAFAGPGSGEPREPADPSSGRPAAVLDDAKCTEVWSLTEREGDALSQGHAAPFIVNFAMVDADGDGKISEAEFKDGCKQGLVQEAAAVPSGQSVPQSTDPIQQLPGAGDASGGAASEPLPQ
ncbi:MAG: EF-hand domain-containing protein [Methyloceanibacter sp.]